MRSIGSELLSVAAVLAVPIGIASVFPYGALGFSAARPAVPAERRAASIVFLDETAVARVMREARSISRTEGGGRAHVDLLSRELPGADDLPKAAIGLRRHPDAPPVVENGIPPFLPSRRAAAPVRISVGTEKDEPPFPRNELLKLN